MTNEEAIKELKEDIDLYNPKDGIIDRETPDGRLITALEMAIKALEQEPCNDCISRQAVLNILQKYTLGESRIAGEVIDLSSITPQPKIGRWIGIEYDGYADGNPVYDVFECSLCGCEHKGELDTLTDYCPDCGAKMETGALDGKAIDFEKLEEECEA